MGCRRRLFWQKQPADRACKSLHVISWIIADNHCVFGAGTERSVNAGGGNYSLKQKRLIKDLPRLLEVGGIEGPTIGRDPR